MAKFRCTVCKGEFVADKPKCDKCGLDPATNKRHAELFHELCVIHYDAPTHAPGIGVGYAACKPSLRVGATKDSFTCVKDVVNCEACKSSESFRREGPPARPPGIETMRFLPTAPGVPDSIKTE